MGCSSNAAGNNKVERDFFAFQKHLPPSFIQHHNGGIVPYLFHISFAIKQPLFMG